jgi:hypothetical protein
VTGDRARQLRALLHADTEDGRVVDRLCRICVEQLSVTGAGIALLTPSGALATVAASDAVMRQVDELQFTVGEGPCVDAFRSGSPVLEPELGVRPVVRWPGFGAEATALGVLAVFAFPLQVGAMRLGALDLYRDAPGSLEADLLADALVLADAATRALLDLEDSATTTPGLGSLDEPTLWRPEVHQATGRVMVQLGVGVQEAFLRLRAYAFAVGRPVSAVARDVAGGSLRLDSPPHDPAP